MQHCAGHGNDQRVFVVERACAIGDKAEPAWLQRWPQQGEGGSRFDRTGNTATESRDGGRWRFRGELDDHVVDPS